MSKREFLQLAHTYKPAKHSIAGCFMSEKLDGMRCFWDGGISRGILKSEIPWANTDKDGRYQVAPVATGLWSRYGNVIHAPDWWLDQLPAIMLDGELFNADYRQHLMSTVKALEPGAGWTDVQYHVFDLVPIDKVFANGSISNTNYKKTLRDIKGWMLDQDFQHQYEAKDKGYTDQYSIMQQLLVENDVLRIHPQEQLPFSTEKATEVMETRLHSIVESGGEGVMLRQPHALYVCERAHHLMKVKPTEDMEGTVIGYVTGRKTDLGSKLLGMMGALILQLDNGVRLELSGFTDNERSLGCTDAIRKHQSEAVQWASEHPETECPDWIEAIHFPRGTRVTFKYRGFSKDGVPQEARYWREHHGV